MTRKGLLLFAAMCVIWGIPYFLIRIAVAGIGPVMLAFSRTVIGALILLPIALSRGGLRELRGKWIPLAAFAAAEIGAPWFFLFSAEQHLSSSLAALLISSVPLLATLVAPLFGNRERFGPVAIGGLALGLAGVGAIVGFDLGSSDVTSLLQMAMVAIGYAVGPAILRRYLGGVRSVTVIGVSLAACAVVYAPFAAFQWPAALPGTDVLVAVLVLGVLCTAAAFVLFFALIEQIGPVRATVITYVNPAVAAVAGVVILRERLTVGMLIGFVLVLAGSILATRRRPPVPQPGAAGARPEPEGKR